MQAQRTKPPELLDVLRDELREATLGYLPCRTGRKHSGCDFPLVAAYFFSSVDSSLKILRSIALSTSSVLALTRPTSVSSGP